MSKGRVLIVAVALVVTSCSDAATSDEGTNAVAENSAVAADDSLSTEPDSFCVQYLSLQGEVPESYVGSDEHLADIESLQSVAPEAIVDELTTFRDYIGSGAVDSTNDPDSNLVENWPVDVVAATTEIVAFGDSTC